MKKTTSLVALAGALTLLSAHAISADGKSAPANGKKMERTVKKMMPEGACGEGKCGASKTKSGEGKCGEGKCGASSKTKAKHAKSGEGKCGEGKCGS